MNTVEGGVGLLLFTLHVLYSVLMYYNEVYGDSY